MIVNHSSYLERHGVKLEVKAKGSASHRSEMKEAVGMTTMKAS